MEDASELLKELDGQDDKKAPILDVSRKMSGVHADLAIRRQSLKDADYKYYTMKNDLANIQTWLEETEKVLRSEKDQNKLQVSCGVTSIDYTTGGNN